MSADAVDARERAAFVDWRRELARLEESEGLVLTPFEKNLEVWRQLWRVLERSHIVVQVPFESRLFYGMAVMHAICADVISMIVKPLI